VYKNRILIFSLFAMLFMVCAVGVSAALNISVNKIALNAGDIQVGGLAIFQINITNSGTENITKINLTDTYNNTCINYSNSYPLCNSSGTGEINWTDSGFFNSPLEPNNSALINVNFTAIKEGSTNNYVNVTATNGSANIDKQDSYEITIGSGGGPGGETWNQGLNRWSSSIVSPYLIRNEAKLLNFSIYRDAGAQSCLKNLTITYPPSEFTFHGQNSSSIDSSNYTIITGSNSITWNATGDDFFCGSGPSYFLINVTSTADYGSGIFTVSAYTNESTQNEEINLTFFTTTTFSYGGTVYDKDGSLLPGAVASITVISFGNRGDLTVGTFSNTTDANGIFNIANIPGLNVSIDEDAGFEMGEGGGLFYRLSATKYNDTPTNHYAMYVGPSLPELPEIELRSDWGLKNASIYLKPAVTFYIMVEGRDYKSGPENDSLCNETHGCSDEAFNWTNIGFSYGLKDKKMGFPVSSDHSSSSITERYFAAPSDRNYSLMVFPEASFPIYIDFTNIETQCNSTGYNISTTGVNATCTTKNGTYFINSTITADQNITPLTGYINNKTQSFDELWIVPYMLGGGSMIFDQDTLPFNMGQMMRWPTNNTAYDDSYNKDIGNYSIYLPATQAHSDIMLMAFAKNSTGYYHDLYKLSLSGKKLNLSELNFTLKPLISGTSKTITSNNISAEWNQTTVVNTTAVQFQLVSNGSVLTADSSFVEMKLETNSIEYTRMVNAQNGVFTLPVIDGGSIKKLTIFSQSYAPVSESISASVLSGATSTNTINCGSGVCNITLLRFDLFDPNNPDEKIDMRMDFYKSNSTCDVPNPPTGCNMMGEGDEGMNKTDFSPLKAILMGDVSLRITSGNISVHYVKTDLLASGPPDAAFSQESNGTDSSAAWKFGSKGPEIYDYVLISMPYSSVIENNQIKMKIPFLYDNDFNVFWNNIDNLSTDLVGTDYSDYLNNSYENYLNETGVTCSETDENLTNGLCYKDTENKVVWMKIPHFTGVGPEVSVGAPTIYLMSPDDNSRTNNTQPSFTFNFTEDISDNASCTLYINSTAYGTNETSYNYTATTITANHSLNESDGYNWWINCTDNDSDEGKSVVRTISIDTTKPIVTEVATEDVTSSTVTLTATTNENANCAYSTSDISYSSMISFITTGTTSHSKSLTGLSASTSYTRYVRCRDTAGNVMNFSNSTTFTTSATSSSGGGSSTPAVTYEEETVGTLAAGSSKAVAFTKSETLAVTEITVTVKNAVTNAKIKVDVGSLPSGASVPSSAKGSVYKYLTMTKTAMTDDDISKAIIKFKIKKSWLTDKGYGILNHQDFQHLQ